MQKDLNIKKIQSKFQQLIQLDQNRKVDDTKNSVNKSYINSILSAQTSSSQQKEENAVKQQKKIVNQSQQLVFTKSDICREVAKLKPYLRNFEETVTTVQKEDRTNKRISDQEQNSLSQLVIYLNKELCQQLKAIEMEESQRMHRQNRQKEGWVYEVFYRYTNTDQAIELSQIVFKNGYVVLTEVMELFPNLTFEQSLIRININEIKRVKYMQQRQYQVIDIRFHDITLHIGFLSDVQMKLFDQYGKNVFHTSFSKPTFEKHILLILSNYQDVDCEQFNSIAFQYFKRILECFSKNIINN